MSYRLVLPSVFNRYYTIARGCHKRIEDATSPFEDDGTTRYFIHDDDPDRGFSGYAVRADGELVFVWSCGRGEGDALVRSALANGAVYLDCFDGYLVDFYARHGFRVVKRVSNWTPGGPDVVYMALPGFEDRHGETPSCPVCIDHPGWAFPESSGRRSDPADVCRACLGSGVRQS